jgi:hypothetical protein
MKTPIYKRLLTLVAAGVLLAFTGVAHAWTSQVMPNYMGGYDTFTPGQPTSQVMRNYMGGNNRVTPGQPPTQIMPNYMGGYNVFTPPSPPTFGAPLPMYQYRAR